MKKLIYGMALLACAGVGSAKGQATIYPAKAQEESIALTGAMIHIGNGQVLENGTVVFDQGKITFVGTSGAPAASKTINAGGKHIYPGFIAPGTNLGLVEVESVRATLDNAEVGDNNAHVRSLVAYNTDSKVINTLRSNGVLLAQITPESGLISGQSSIVQLDAWNWEDAAYHTDDALHINWPAVRQSRYGAPTNVKEQEQRVQKQIMDLEQFIADARAYSKDGGNSGQVFNARLGAMKGVFDGRKKVLVHADRAKDIIQAIQTLKKYNI